MKRPKKIVEDDEPVIEQPAVVEEETGKSVSITFVGDPRGGADPEVAEYGGKEFPKGKAVTVDDANWLSINANIRTNNHFKVV